MNLPLIKETIERVAPQEGQGIFVRFFITQTSIALLSFMFVIVT